MDQRKRHHTQIPKNLTTLEITFKNHNEKCSPSFQNLQISCLDCETIRNIVN